MKHVFIVNPGAGQGMKVSELQEKLQELDIDYEIYETKAAKDATSYVRGRCESGEELRFYACGGDGTLKEVMEGTIGFANASITCYPVGSGNDFVKCFGGMGKFMDLKNIVHSDAKPTDEPFGPIACTSTKQIATVHSTNTISRLTEVIKFFLMLFIFLPSFFVFAIYKYNFMEQ